MNPLLQLDEERFVRSLASQHMSIPPYFRRARDRNLDGAPTMPNAVREVNPTDFGELDKGGTTVIDAREPKAFAGSHVPRSLNIWLDGMRSLTTMSPSRSSRRDHLTPWLLVHICVGLALICRSPPL
jgi:hypothetical protein